MPFLFLVHCPSRDIPWKKYFLILNRLNYFKSIPSYIPSGTFWIREMFLILGAKYRFSLMWVIIRFWYPTCSSHNYPRIETCNTENISLKIIITLLVLLIKTIQSSPHSISNYIVSKYLISIGYYVSCWVDAHYLCHELSQSCHNNVQF